MPLNIEVNLFDQASLKRAAEQIRAYEKRFREKQEIFVKRLADECVKVIQAKYAPPQPYAGQQVDIEVNAVFEGLSATIVASGETLLFLEFGTGVTHREASYGPFKHGTYGQGKGRQKIWGFYLNGDKESLVLTSGNDPIEAFPAAERRIEEIFANVAREVFGGD